VPGHAVAPKSRIVTKNHVRKHTVLPLAAQQAQQLGLRPINIEMSQPNSGEATIPQPLVRVESTGGHSVSATIISL